MDRTRVRNDIVGLVILFATVFLVVCLLSFDPADPPSRATYPANRVPSNLCGMVGAMVAYHLLNVLGLGAWVLVVALAWSDLMIFRAREVPDKLLRVIGACLVTVAACSMAVKLIPSVHAPLPVGPGGYLGAAAAGFLEESFSGFGTYLMLLATGVVGLLLACDQFVLGLLGGLLKGPKLLASTALGRVVRRADAVEAPVVRPSPAKKPTPKPTPQPDPEPQPAEEDASAPSEQGEPERRAPVVRPPVALPEPDTGTDQPEARPEPVVTGSPGATMELSEFDQSDGASDANYELPSLDLLRDVEPFPFDEHERQVREKAVLLEKTLADFGLTVRVVAIDTGPVITQYEVELEPGLRVGKVINLADDLAIALKATSVRVVAPLPGKNTVGVEVPNDRRALVTLKDVMLSVGDRASTFEIPMYVGKDVSGSPIVCDLGDMPHLLIAGRTGSGKSVMLNSMITSILMTKRPDEVKMLIVDPAMVEMVAFAKVPHLMHPLVTDMRKAEALLAWAVDKMDERYDLLSQAGVRHIAMYNDLGEEEVRKRFASANDEEMARIPFHMPYIIIVVDELADLMMTSAKEVETYITRLAQKSRKVGIHLILATQRPSVDVITGLIKSNLPARISFQVSSRVDSRTILDEIGAEKLLGHGDMLFLQPGTAKIIRVQGTYVSDDEIRQVTQCVERDEPQYYRELVQLRADPDGDSGDGKPNKLQGSRRDDLYTQAVEVVIQNQRGSVSLLQRALEIGYSRAARLIDMMAEDGIVGEYNGSQAREVVFTPEEWEAIQKSRHEDDA